MSVNFLHCIARHYVARRYEFFPLPQSQPETRGVDVLGIANLYYKIRLLIISLRNRLCLPCSTTTSVIEFQALTCFCADSKSASCKGQMQRIQVPGLKQQSTAEHLSCNSSLLSLAFHGCLALHQQSSKPAL